MTISFASIFTRCQNASSYEGQRLRDSEGKSLYEVVHITEIDKTLIYEYALECAGLIAKELRFALEGVSYVDKGDTTFNFITDLSLHGRTDDTNMKKDIEGTITAYVMWTWLSNKDTNRSNVWHAIYDTMFKSLPRGIYRRRPRRPSGEQLLPPTNKDFLDPED